MGIFMRISVLSFLLAEVISSGTTFTFFREPSASVVRRYLERQDTEQSPVNHAFAGFSDIAAAGGDAAVPPPPPQGFQERTVRAHLGSGKETYARGREALLRWQMHEGSSWARIFLGQRPPRPALQRNLVTIAKACAGLVWCINPCQVLYERNDVALRFIAPPGADANRSLDDGEARPVENTKRVMGGGGGALWAGKRPTSAPSWASFLPGVKHKGRQSAVAYATKMGHLIQGEERMRVLHFCGPGGDDSVWFEVYSVSRGAGLVGGLVFPFVQSMQRRFFREQAETMKRVVNSSSGLP
ncbi:conserved unknown protein [Ectocarpus siliculosus]|uniref:DUF1990 domain-containing protein n=1 Tax=Ectocarpus siliculosus TaxID=2880 RepID=D8LQ57_ECTSI|nr:conserved unknown protein [Ectocarpus siliculosus]|eukprot:CBN77437.1 conserved unknown protein [Ectocarpus siliculosus]